MTTFISLLRGINVSGQKKIKMPELKAIYDSLGFEDVTTYIQSGNVVFNAIDNTCEEISEQLESAILDALGYKVTVILRSQEDFRSIVENNPFSGADLGKLHVTFLKQSTEQPDVERLEGVRAETEQFAIADTHVYVYCPNGYGRTKLNNNLIERACRVAATTRNWNSVSKLLAMAEKIA